MDRVAETVLAGLAGQLKRNLARELDRNDGRLDDEARAQLMIAIDELVDVAASAQQRAEAAVRQREALDRIMTDVEERLGVEIVAHEQTRSELGQKRAALREVVESLPYCIFWRDRNGVYLGANRNKLKALGLSSLDQLVGKTPYETGISREEADFYRSVDEQVMRSGQPIFNMEETLRRPDGDRVLLMSKVPLRDDGGGVVGILGMYVDVTERRRLEAAPRPLVAVSPIAAYRASNESDA